MMEGVHVEIGKNSAVENNVDINKILTAIVNMALSESCDVKFSRHTFDKHKDNGAAQESHLKKGDVFEIMTNTLTYDLDDRSLVMISNNLCEGVKYNYYLEKNSLVSDCLVKFVRSLYQRIKDSCGSVEKANKVIEETLHLYWIEEGAYIYNFSLFNRSESNIRDHCTFYFIKKKILYEALLETVPHMVEDLKKVFAYFKKNQELQVFDMLK